VSSLPADGPEARRLGPRAKLELGFRIWFWSMVARILLRIRPLPAVVGQLRSASTRDEGRVGAGVSEARLLGRRVHRVLNVGPFRARCLVGALVLFRLLRQSAVPTEIVVGLRDPSESHEAHAWVELGGVDVGPPPGRHGHRELARYG
jgi:hypothetical protein